MPRGNDEKLCFCWWQLSQFWYLLSTCDAGWLYDVSDSYDNSFYMAGICLIVSGLMFYSIPCIQRRRLRHDNQETQLNAETDQELQV